MAKVTKTFYQCDRCGKEMETPVIGSERGPARYQITAHQDHGAAGGNVIEWKDLCKPCNTIVGNTIHALRDAAKVQAGHS